MFGGGKFGEFGESSVAKLKPSKLAVTINDHLADIVNY